MKKLPILVALATNILVPSTQAAEAWSIDSGNCADFVADRGSGEAVVDKQLDAWLIGFLTAANFYAPIGQDVHVSSTESMAMWVETWCGENPMETTTAAVDALIKERRAEQ